MDRSMRELQHPRFARWYAKFSPRMETQGGVAEHRRRLLAGLRGTVVDVGIGNGLNLPHYPPEVTEVIGVEPDDHLRSLAETAARELAETAARELGESAARDAPVSVRVVAGRAEKLPVDDASCDAVVSSLVLCSVHDQAVALAEYRRVLKPGGEVRFFEHVRARSALVAFGQTLLVPATTRLLGGCHFNRDTVAAIEAAGFTVGEIDRFPANGLPHTLGTAT